jgi:serine/threonine-protein kinase
VRDQTFGPYRVLDKLGEGGMGVVYRARDTRLERDVALKVLPDVVSNDPDRLARFEREARVLASHNHPNIAQIFGFERDDDRQAIAMELVEGSTLAEMVAGAEPGSRGLGLDQALAIARQIADALEAAHDQGVIHRDLKPANVKVRDDGTVKVLDFGLAKAMAPDEGASAPNAANSPTLTARATELGLILGTAAYMAPEQAKGRRVDKRADVWAFGVVLFEMLTGRRAFEGDDVSETLASVLAREPKFDALPAETPTPVRRLIERCLEKDPRKRLRDIGDAMRRLDEEMAAPTAAGDRAATAPAAGPPGTGSGIRRWLAPALTLVVGLAGGAWLLRPPPAPAGEPGVVRFTYAPPQDGPAPLQMPGQRDVMISADGQQVLFRWASSGTDMSFALRRMDETDAVPVRGTEHATAACFSPDGQSIALVLDGDTLARIPVTGGRPQVLTESETPVFGMAWTEDGRIIFGTRAGGLFSVPETGGRAEALTTPAGGGHVWPLVLPGTRAIVFVENEGPSSPLVTGRLMLLNLGSGDVTPLELTGASPTWANSGHLLYVTPESRVWAVPFDLARLTVSGRPAPVIEEVGTGPSGAADFAVSGDGRLVYLTDAGGLERRLVWVDRSGASTPLPAPPRQYTYAWLSPDETQLSLDIRDEGRDIWVYDIARDTLQRRSVTPTDDEYGLWASDGSELVFSNQQDLFRLAANGTSGPQPITTSSGSVAVRFPNAVTADGRVVYRGPGQGTGNDLFIVPLDGSAEPEPLVASEFDELNAALSPDGRWLAYQSDQAGRPEVFVRPFPDVHSGLHQISNAGGVKPAWSRDGTELFYLDNSRQMMRVGVRTAGGFSASPPEMLFDASRFFAATVGRNYDVASDGRFIMIDPEMGGDNRTRSLSFVINWFGVLEAIR